MHLALEMMLSAVVQYSGPNAEDTTPTGAIKNTLTGETLQAKQNVFSIFRF